MTYAKSAWLFGRGLGLVFLVAFVSWHAQQAGLIGERGITPATELMSALEARGMGYRDVPTFAWLFGASDGALHAICVLGELASVALLVGALPGPMALLATLLYLSLRVIGGPFMAFQWDILLVETGWVAALFLPWRAFDGPKALTEPPPLARWALYALAFRLMFLSGAVKLMSGDPAWSDLRALDYHYWTQPLPGPLSWFVHQLPSWVHEASVLTTFLVELVLPWLIVVAGLERVIDRLVKRRVSEVRRRVQTWLLRAPGLGFIALMILIALTGHYGFFNLLTIVIALPLLDDALLERVPGLVRGDATRSRPERWIPDALATIPLTLGALALLVGLGAPLPEWSHGALAKARRFHLTSTYGLFAVMTTTRREIELEGSLDGETWRAYRFAHKPGDPRALPGWSAPHMPRLDWQMWFAALGEHRDSPWLRRLMNRLLEAEPTVLALFAEDPFDGQAPRYVRARVSAYRFGDWDLLMETGQWWEAEPLGPYAPTLTRPR